MDRHRDMGITTIRTRMGRHCYGMGVGIILLDQEFPGFPGDMRNASAYPFPIQYEIAEGVDGDALVFMEDKSSCLDPMRRAAQKLERMGCRAIAGECGYFAYFQKEIAGYVEVPVFMSSLLQVPWAQQLVGPKKEVGMLVAFKNHLTTAHLEAVGIPLDSRYVIAGAVDSGRCPELNNMCGFPEPDKRSARYDQLEQEVVEIAVDFYQSHSTMGALVIECSAMQPFARAIQREIDIPIFSWGTLLDYAYSVVVHRDYYGHV